MNFSSTIFLFCFLPIVTMVCCLLHKRLGIQNAFLVVVSLLFYAWGEPIAIILLILSIVVNWVFSIIIYRQNQSAVRKWLKVIVIAGNIFLLVYFKYLGFLQENINFILNLLNITANVTLQSPILPVGISFFIFQEISYIVDIENDKDKTCSFLEFALYISFFPKLLSGPLVRYEQFLGQIRSRKMKLDGLVSGIDRFVLGLGKKTVLAGMLAIVVDEAFLMTGGADNTVMLAWLGAIGYTLQIYFDFSGYTDMAIGLGKMFGFELCENFNYPYLAVSVSDFWKRWHISLSTWMRDYIYIPCGGNKCSKPVWMRNMLITWLFTGIWHGANWTFVLWGLIFCALLIMERQTQLSKFLSTHKIISRIYALLVIIFTWVIFRAANIKEAFTYIGTMIGLSNHQFINQGAVSVLRSNAVLYVVAILMSFPVLKKLQQSNGFLCRCAYRVIWFAVMIVSLSFVIIGSYNPFIYFNF